MKLKLLLFFLPLVLRAQAGSLPLACTGGRSGGTATCTLSLSTGGSPQTLAFTSSISLPGAVITTAVAASTTAAGKNITCNSVAACIVWGVNTNGIADGPVATLTIAIPQTTGNVTATVSVTSTLGASLAALAIAENPPSPVSVSVVNPCDVNGDGLINAIDVNAIVANYLARPQVTTDLNKDGVFNVVDIQVVINAVMGLGCSAQ